MRVRDGFEVLSSARHLRSRDERWPCVKVTVAPRLRPAQSKHLARPVSFTDAYRGP